MKILDKIHEMIDENTSIAILKLTKSEAEKLHDYLSRYHFVDVPEFDQWLPRATFLGRKVEIYENVQEDNR